MSECNIVFDNCSTPESGTINYFASLMRKEVLKYTLAMFGTYLNGHFK